MGRYVCSLLIFGASPGRNRVYYLNQMALFLLDLCKAYASRYVHPYWLSNVYFGLDAFNILKNTFIFHYLCANTFAFVHLFESHATLKCLKIFAYHFPLPGPSYSPILAWSFTILDCVLHKYFIWVNIPLLSEFLSWACPEFSWRSEYERAWVPLLTLHLFHFLLFSLTDLIWISELKCRVSELPVHRINTLELLEYICHEDTPLDVFLISVSGSTVRHPFL